MPRIGVRIPPRRDLVSSRFTAGDLVTADGADQLAANFRSERDSLFHQLQNQGFDDRAVAACSRG